MTELPSESELFEGRMKDGSRPPLRSHELYWHWDKPIPGGNEDLTPMQIDAEKLHQQIDTRHLAQLDKAIAFAEALVNAGLSALKNAPADPRPQADDVAQAPPPAQAVGAPPTAADRKKDSDPLIKQREEGRTPGRPIAEGSDVTVPIPPYDPDARDVDVIMDNFAKVQAALLAAGESSAVVGATTACAGEAPALRACAGEGACATAASQLPLEKLLPLAEKGARLLVTASGKRAELAHKLVDRALGMDIRRSFLQDRAIGVVYATLLSLDEQFRDVGFGSWMPFRFPDQWLSFCGIMRRVLAANGLIHSKHADVYRRLLDETPPVEIEGEVQDRVKLTKTPHNPARCWENRGAENMDALRERLYHEVDHPPYPPPRKQCAPY